LVGLSIAVALALSGHPRGAFAIGAVTLVMLASAWVWPLTAYSRFEGALNAFGRAVGRLLAWVLLVPVFLVFFWGFGRWRRGGRRDALQRWVDPQASSYWRPRPVRGTGIAPYQRQF
jgi:hypothetical protein